MMSNHSEIVDFFSDQSVFITGGSGFIGKVAIEKLLRIVPTIKKIYILLRPKRGISFEERAKNFFDYACFDKLKFINPNFTDKVRFLEGNCSEVSLGLSEDDWQLLINEVNIVLNLAADVRFNSHLRNATYNNVRSVQEMLRLAKEISNLKVWSAKIVCKNHDVMANRQVKSGVIFVFISNHMDGKAEIKEDIYEPPISAEDLYKILDIFSDREIAEITPTLLRKWANTYVYTKCIAESLIKRELQNLPIAIVRPSIIISTAKDPMPGWIDNFYGIVGISIGVALGGIKVFRGKKDAKIFAVPCDYVVNLIFAVAWYTSKKWELNKHGRMVVYNYVGSLDKIMSLEVYMKKSDKYKYEYTLSKAFAYPSITIIENYYIYKTCEFVLQFIPAYIADFVLFCINKKPFAVKKMKKVSELLDLTSYFMLNYFHFENKNSDKLWDKLNEHDKQLIPYSDEGFDIDEYLVNSYKGGKHYLLGESMETPIAAKVKYIILGIIHYALIGLFYYLMYKFFVNLFMF